MKTRKGAAVVEFALILPVFGILMLGMLEVGRAVQVQQTITNAAREGARLAVVKDTTSTEVTAAVKSYLTNAGLSANAVSATTVTIVTTPGTDTDPGRATVTVSVPQASVAWIKNSYITAPHEASASMRREGYN